MGTQTLHVLSAGQQLTTAPLPNHPSDELWLDSKNLERATGWQLKPEGLCRDDACMIISPADRERLVDGDAVCASGLWEKLERPVLSDANHSTWILGEAAADRSRGLESLEAPDFTLPDIEGKLHSLSDYRGKKVFLATWASW
jgi:hypothetical protein